MVRNGQKIFKKYLFVGVCSDHSWDNDRNEIPKFSQYNGLKRQTRGLRCFCRRVKLGWLRQHWSYHPLIYCYLIHG